MKRYAIVVGTLALLGLTAGCATSGYYETAPNYNQASYDLDCDYYTPPWGYPADYCRYRVWDRPVYYSGVWFSGPIYYRTYAGVNWFWLNGDWRRDEWRGVRPRIDFNNGRNQFWRGDIHRQQAQRGRPGVDRAPPRAGSMSPPGSRDRRGDSPPTQDGRSRGDGRSG